MTEPRQTLYQIAAAEIRRCIEEYLILAKTSKGLAAIQPEHLVEERARVIVMAGLGVASRPATAEEAHSEWQRRQALVFDVETGITAGVYTSLRTVADVFYEQLEVASNGFTYFDPGYIFDHPHLLPVMQHLAGVFSKSRLTEIVGPVSDVGISKPMSSRRASNCTLGAIGPSSSGSSTSGSTLRNRRRERCSPASTTLSGI